MNHSPSKKTVEPNHEEANTPTKIMKIIDVMNPRPVHNTTGRKQYVTKNEFQK